MCVCFPFFSLEVRPHTFLPNVTSRSSEGVSLKQNFSLVPARASERASPEPSPRDVVALLCHRWGGWGGGSAEAGRRSTLKQERRASLRDVSAVVAGALRNVLAGDSEGVVAGRRRAGVRCWTVSVRGWRRARPSAWAPLLWRPRRPKVWV